MSGLDFHFLGTAMFVLGAIQTALALFETYRPQPPTARRHGWPLVLGGIGFMLVGFAERRRAAWDEPTSVVAWAGTLIVFAGVLMILARWARIRAAKNAVK